MRAPPTLAWVVLAAALAMPVSGWAQDAVRVPATVDYVGTDGLYLTVGSDHGAIRGDTLDVFIDSLSNAPWGRVVLTAVTRRRSVARELSGSRVVTVGSVFFLPLVPPPTRAAESAVEAQPVRDVPPPAPVRAAATGASLTGRLSFDLDARETRTTWSGDLSGETTRRFATPTTRLSLQANRLPGGFVMRANLRAAYRYDDVAVGPPPVSVRAYELSATRTFRAPFVLMLGRFANPYERYSAYWDGVLLRVGRDRGLGVGAVAGYEPSRHDEGFSTDLPKLTGFLDYSGGGGAWRYDTDLSLHFLAPVGGVRSSYAGWTQRISVGAFDLSQRLRMDGGLDGRSWSMADLRLRVGLDLFGPLRLRGAYSRARTGWGLSPSSMTPVADLAGPLREEGTLGMDLGGTRAYASFDAGRTRRDGDDAGWSTSGMVGSRFGGGGLSIAVQRWTRGAAESLGVSPSLDATVAAADVRAGYRFYRTDLGQGTLSSHAAHATVGVDLTRDLHLSVRGERQWGAQLSGTAFRISIWRSF